MKKAIIGFLLSTTVFSAFAQADTLQSRLSIQPGALPDTAAPKPVTIKPKSYFSASVGFLSNSVYNGRKDSVSTPYLTPSFGYYDKSGLFIDASLSYLARAGSSRVDLFTITAGYDFYLGNFDGEVSASKSFYNNSSTNVQSEIAGSVFFTGGYDFDFIKPTIEAGINLGSKPDYLLNLGLEHTFYTLKDKLQITPSFRASGSTQNYYGAYYNKRKVGAKRKNAGIVYDVTTTVDDAAQYKILAYEWSLPISYTCKKITFSLSPAYVLPVHPAQVTTVLVPEGSGISKTKTVSEVVSNSFYCSFGLSYKL